jgi:hypothetical protein
MLTASSAPLTAVRMPRRHKNSLGPLILHHGCDREVAESVLSGKETLQPSENDYDWLGPGIYFWVDSPERALDWAKDRKQRRPQEMGEPSVVGAFAYSGNCLNLTDYGVMDELSLAYRATETLFKRAESPLPVNSDRRNGIYLKRQLDCAVIQMVHELRRDQEEPPYDTVYGVFEEGSEVYPGPGFLNKTHVQISICNPEMILGYFRGNGMT